MKKYTFDIIKQVDNIDSDGAQYNQIFSSLYTYMYNQWKEDESSTGFWTSFIPNFLKEKYNATIDYQYKLLIFEYEEDYIKFLLEYI